MTAPKSKTRRLPALRKLAESRVPRRASVPVEALTPDEIRQVLHEMEVHKVELEIQNTQLRVTQQEAEEGRDQYRKLYESAPIGFLTIGRGGTIVEANSFLARLLHVPKGRLIGQKVSTFVAPQHQDRWHRAKRRVLDEGETDQTLDLQLLGAEGVPILVQLMGLAVEGQGDASRNARFALMDVTKLRTTERALRTAAMAASLAEEDERRKLAADLHDDAGQLLSLAALKLAGVSAALGPELAAQVRAVAEIVANARSRISSLSFQLSPPLLHDLGLVAALQWLSEDMERSYGLQVSIADQSELELDEIARVTLFRAIRELLFNVAKHAGVKEARVRIWSEERVVCIAVEDDGVGLPVAANRQGFGLLALRERLEHLGGTLETRSTPGGGTTVLASLPLAIRQQD